MQNFLDRLHIDLETFSDIDLKESGVYKYTESHNFEILTLSYSINDGPVIDVPLALGAVMPDELVYHLNCETTLKLAHNALFERRCLMRYGFNIPPEYWECTAVKASYCGLPASLENVSTALELGDKSKSAAGKALIKFFCVVQSNGTRNMPQDFPEKFQELVDYCNQDVVAEKEVDDKLSIYEVCQFERENYFIDQHINDRGIKVDLQFAKAAYDLDTGFKSKVKQRLVDITGLVNPNSPKQLTDWLNNAQNEVVVKSIAKENLIKLSEVATGAVLEVLELRAASSKTSTAKYTAMLNAACFDGVVRGCFQFYGANKTGRWAGRIVQLQNLPINKYLIDMDNGEDAIDIARNVISRNDQELAELVYGFKLPVVLSELIRPAFIARDGYTFAVSDFSAIEARVLSWLASEEWRMEVFATHGKIYEAAAANMFNVPIEAVTKSSEYRMRAKNAELALGYQGALEAMRRMGGEKMGLSDSEMNELVRLWRKVNPKIVTLWNDYNNFALEAMLTPNTRIETGYRNTAFIFDGTILKMMLPSGRYISYYEAYIKTNRFGSMCISYRVIDQKTSKWVFTETYGGKLIENAVQAISRDILVTSMKELAKHGFIINMHVHDEVICEVDELIGDSELTRMENIMKQPIDWAPDLVLGAAGYVTKYYRKD
jgi:DNA polymerase